MVSRRDGAPWRRDRRSVAKVSGDFGAGCGGAEARRAGAELHPAPKSEETFATRSHPDATGRSPGGAAKREKILNKQEKIRTERGPTPRNPLISRNLVSFSRFGRPVLFPFGRFGGVRNFQKQLGIWLVFHGLTGRLFSRLVDFPKAEMSAFKSRKNTGFYLLKLERIWESELSKNNISEGFEPFDF